MQQDKMNKNDLAVEITVKAAWSKPEIEVIDIGTTEGNKANFPSEASSSLGPS
ncbi:hypothetical protein Q4Q49_16480 [Shewanella sp. SP1S1-7]|uniref:hypothetical protein n=1 Tax=Shewanella sp. SP1S1-7 TaxID=3063536 RepID=UPI00288EF0C4|nr:hypothetical protein [Shewanella sp. SP1S1-7]MDT3336882.1 hypothetical protein [Shewanella sp. SP1S1-7]